VVVVDAGDGWWWWWWWLVRYAFNSSAPLLARGTSLKNTITLNHLSIRGYEPTDRRRIWLLALVVLPLLLSTAHGS
jgi:hypothetical protein